MQIEESFVGTKTDSLSVVWEILKSKGRPRLQAKPRRSHYFLKHFEGGKLIILLVYVDNNIVTGDDLTKRHLLKEKLSTEFGV